VSQQQEIGSERVKQFDGQVVHVVTGKNFKIIANKRWRLRMLPAASAPDKDGGCACPLLGAPGKRWRRLTRVWNWEKAAALLCAKGRDHPRISVGSFFVRIRGLYDMFTKPRKPPTIAPSAPPVPPSLIADLLSIAINHAAHASLPAQIRLSFTLIDWRTSRSCSVLQPRPLFQLVPSCCQSPRGIVRWAGRIHKHLLGAPTPQ